MMGARQSNPSVQSVTGNSSDGPSGGNVIFANSNSNSSTAGSSGLASRSNSSRHHHGQASWSSSDWRQRARSLSNVINGTQPNGSPMGVCVPHPQGHSSLVLSASPDSDTSTDDGLPFGRILSAQSLPVQFTSFHGIKCPVCNKNVLPDDVECHLVMCLTKPRINYNEDVLSEEKGECVICLEELLQGDTIARLPCLCIYHKHCIDAWFEINRCCPEHPSD